LLSAASSQEIPAALIRVEDLWCGYPGHDVLRGLSFAVEEGEFIGVLGPNGSGKTTLLLALSGILPVRGGAIEVLGSPLGRLKHKERARRMAVVTQESDVRFPFTCEEVVRMGRYPHQKRWQLDSIEDAEAVRQAMILTDTGLLAQRLITAVSGGERQSVIMAKTLAQRGTILLLDEATSAMDIHRKLQIFKVLDQLHAENGLTVLAVMHDVNLAALFCRRIIFLKDGEVVADGEPNSVLIPEILEEVYQTPVIIQKVPIIEKLQVVFMP
jgi:iron complex transport system ATP-binding protein